MNRWFPFGLMIISSLLLLLGCSGGSSPVIPQAEEQGLTPQTIRAISSQVLWGMWEVAIDPDTSEFVPVPIRGVMFQANVTRFLQPPDSPAPMLSIAIDGSSNLPDGYVVADVTIKHPFVGFHKFRGFDVMGILMADGSLGFNPVTIQKWPALNETRILNADGYTRWWNPTEFTTYGTIFGYTEGAKASPGYLASATINGYKYFADVLGPEDSLDALNMENRGSFSVVSGINTRRYEIQFAMTPDGTPDFHFNYAVTASYALPFTDDDPSYPVESFPLTANLTEAFRIDVYDNGSTAWYVDETNNGGNLDFYVEVYDWGLKSTVLPEIEVLAVIVWSPTLPGKTVIPYEPGSTDHSWKYHYIENDVSPTSVWGQEIMVHVESNWNPTYQPEIPDPSGFDYPLEHLTAYQRWEVPISPVEPQENQPPEVGVIDGPDFMFQDEDGVYTLSYANDPEDGTNLTIFWDNDGDLDFDDDLDGDDTNLEATLNFPDKFYHNVVARAVDSGDLFADTDPFEVYVEGCPTEVHEDFDEYVIDNGTSDYYVRMECAYQTVGEYAGYMLTQNGPYQVSLYDTSQTSPWTGIPYIDLFGTVDDTDKIFSLDVCDYSGRVVMSLMHVDDVRDPSLFDVYNVDGEYLTTISVGKDREVMCIDTDENGDLWISSWENWHDDNDNHEIDPGEGVTSQIQHYEYLEDSPYYLEDPSDEYDISDQFPGNNEMWDLAVSYTAHRIYAMRGNYSFPNPWAEYGEIFTWDIANDGTLSFNPDIQELFVFPGEVKGSYTTYHGSIVGGDIEFDHSANQTEGCRLVVMAKKIPASGAWGHYFQVMDEELNVIDTVEVQDQLPRYSFALRQDKYPFNREICVPSFNDTNKLYRFPAPTGW